MEAINGQPGGHVRPSRESFSKDEDVKKYRDIVFKFILNNLGVSENNIVLAEEITQETMLLVWKNIDQFKGNSDVTTWLLAIARNAINSHFRYVKAARFPDRDMYSNRGVFRLEAQTFKESEDEVDVSPDSLTHNPGVLDNLIEEDKNKLISSFVAKIRDPIKKEIFLMSCNGCRTAEISEKLHVKAAHVKTTLFRLRQKLVSYVQAKKLVADQDLLAKTISNIRGNMGKEKAKNPK